MPWPDCPRSALSPARAGDASGGLGGVLPGQYAEFPDHGPWPCGVAPDRCPRRAGDRAAPAPVLLAQHVGRPQLPAGPARRQGTIRLLSHCTETTALLGASTLWVKIFAALGLRLETPATACFGMAGLLSHQKRHQTVSRRLFDLSWRDKTLDDTPRAILGFSCRCQTLRLTNEASRHPLGAIADALSPPVQVDKSRSHSVDTQSPDVALK